MTEWAGPARDRPVGESRTEVPLAGPDPTRPEPADPAGLGREAPNWRKIVGLSALAGAVLGIVVAVIMLGGRDDDRDQPAATTDPDDLSAAIAVPATLTPVTEPPATTLAGPRRGATGLTEAARVAASVVTLAPEPGVDAEVGSGFRLSGGSLAALDSPLARRSVTDHVVGADGYLQKVTITNDPATGRYLLEVERDGEIETVVTDLPGGVTYVEIQPGEWTTIPNQDVADAFGLVDMATFLRAMQLGPIRSDLHDSWELAEANSLVDSGGEKLREWIVVLDAAAVPEWARYALGPGGEAAPLPGNTPIGYAVYVAEDGSIRRVSGSAEFGATTQRIVHEIVELDSPPVIELPDVSITTSSTP